MVEVETPVGQGTRTVHGLHRLGLRRGDPFWVVLEDLNPGGADRYPSCPGDPDANVFASKEEAQEAIAQGYFRADPENLYIVQNVVDDQVEGVEQLDRGGRGGPVTGDLWLRSPTGEEAHLPKRAATGKYGGAVFRCGGWTDTPRKAPPGLPRCTRCEREANADASAEPCPTCGDTRRVRYKDGGRGPCPDCAKP